MNCDRCVMCAGRVDFYMSRIILPHIFMQKYLLNESRAPNAVIYARKNTATTTGGVVFFSLGDLRRSRHAFSNNYFIIIAEINWF